MHDPRFPDPGLAAEQDHLALALPRALEPVEQHVELLLAPNSGVRR